MERPLNFIVSPAGAWPTTLGQLVAELGHNVALHFRSQIDSDNFNRNQENTKRLPGKKLSENIKGVFDIGPYLPNADIVIIGTPAPYFRESSRGIMGGISDKTRLLIVTKGIEVGTNLLMSEIIEQEHPGIHSQVVVLSGPNFASEIIEGKYAASVVASSNPNTAEFIQGAMGRGKLRLYTSDDIKGVQLGGALKNVIAIAAGISDGLDMGISARSSLVNRGWEEVTNLGEAMGADKDTFRGLSGSADMMASCSALSRNFLTGFNLGAGSQTPDEILNSNLTVEGVNTVRAVIELSRQYKVEMPVTDLVYAIIYEGRAPIRAIGQLMSRPLKRERTIMSRNGY